MSDCNNINFSSIDYMSNNRYIRPDVDMGGSPSIVYSTLLPIKLPYKMTSNNRFAPSYQPSRLCE